MIQRNIHIQKLEATLCSQQYITCSTMGVRQAPDNDDLPTFLLVSSTWELRLTFWFSRGSLAV